MDENISKLTNTDHRSVVNIEPAERIISSTVGGLLLASGMARKNRFKIPALIAGAALLVRGISGYSLLYDTLGKERIPKIAKNINIRTRLIVNRPRKEVYAFWRELENLPLFLTHLQSVEKIDEKYSVWKAKIPGKVITIDWTAEIVKEIEDEFLGWSSIPDSTIDNAGKVEFFDAENGLSTEIDVVISYRPPLGVLGAGLAHLLNPTFEKMVEEDISNFRTFMETGQVPRVGKSGNAKLLALNLNQTSHMEKNSKTATFTGGPLDGQTRIVEAEQSVYKHEQPPVSDDIRLGEIPVGFFPPMHEYVYEESPAGSGSFKYVAQLHQ